MKITAEIQRAIDFATKAHEGQVRKYTNEPYITHPLAVAEIVAEVTENEDSIIAAILHDVVEDTDISINKIQEKFGHKVADYVNDLTEYPSVENRLTRKRQNVFDLSQGYDESKTIKLADLIHNTESIVKHDPKFAKLYMFEKAMLLGALVDGHSTLYIRAEKQLRDYFL